MADVIETSVVVRCKDAAEHSPGPSTDEPSSVGGIGSSSEFDCRSASPVRRGQSVDSSLSSASRRSRNSGAENNRQRPLMNPIAPNVSFAVQCRTLPGEHIFLSGSVPELGCWKPSCAVRLETSEVEWPLWWSPAVQFDADWEAVPGASLRADCGVESRLEHGAKDLCYKYLVAPSIGEGEVRWELGRDRRLCRTSLLFRSSGVDDGEFRVAENTKKSQAMSHVFEIASSHQTSEPLRTQEVSEGLGTTSSHSMEDSIDPTSTQRSQDALVAACALLPREERCRSRCLSLASVDETVSDYACAKRPDPKSPLTRPQRQPSFISKPSSGVCCGGHSSHQDGRHWQELQAHQSLQTSKIEYAESARKADNQQVPEGCGAEQIVQKGIQQSQADFGGTSELHGGVDIQQAYGLLEKKLYDLLSENRQLLAALHVEKQKREEAEHLCSAKHQDYDALCLDVILKSEKARQAYDLLEQRNLGLLLEHGQGQEARDVKARAQDEVASSQQTMAYRLELLQSEDAQIEAERDLHKAEQDVAQQLHKDTQAEHARERSLSESQHRDEVLKRESVERRLQHSVSECRVFLADGDSGEINRQVVERACRDEEGRVERLLAERRQNQLEYTEERLHGRDGDKYAKLEIHVLDRNHQCHLPPEGQVERIQGEWEQVSHAFGEVQAMHDQLYQACSSVYDAEKQRVSHVSFRAMRWNLGLMASLSIGLMP